MPKTGLKGTALAFVLMALVPACDDDTTGLRDEDRVPEVHEVAVFEEGGVVQFSEEYVRVKPGDTIVWGHLDPTATLVVDLTTAPMSSPRTLNILPGLTGRAVVQEPPGDPPVVPVGDFGEFIRYKYAVTVTIGAGEPDVVDPYIDVEPDEGGG